MAKKKKVRRIKFKNIFLLLCFIILIGYLFYYILMLPIKNIYITGNEIIGDDEIIKLGGIEDYPSFLLTSSKEIKNSILKNDYIKDVKVTKKFGNVLEISIEEYYALCITKSNQIILSNSYILDNDYNLGDIPVLTNDIEDEVYDDFVLKFSEVDKDILRQISEIEYSPVSVDNERFLLYMDDGNLVYITLTKISKLNKYNSIKAQLEERTGIIYLDSGNYIELKDENSENNSDEENSN